MKFKDIENEMLLLVEEKKKILESFKNLDRETFFEAIKSSKRLVEIEQRIAELIAEIELVVKNIYKVYIIESPGAKDIIERRVEGIGMTQYLGLANIDTEYYLCKTVAEVNTALGKIAQDVKLIIKNKKQEEVFSPIIHFSAHGNNDLIGFTDNSTMKWEELGDALYKLNEDAGIDISKFMSDFIITLSVCNGASLNKVIKEGRGTPFYIMIGADDTIPWTDSILGFQVFFHHLIHKSRTIGYAIKKMKEATDNNNFVYYTDKLIKLIE